MASKKSDTILVENVRLKQRYAKLEQALKEAGEYHEKLAKPPFYYGIFFKRNKDGTADVFVDSRSLPVRIGDLLYNSMNADVFKAGDLVILNSAMNIAGKADENALSGIAVRFKKRLDINRAWVVHQTQEFVGILTSSLRSQELKSGDTLRMDTAFRFIFEKLPESTPPSFAKDYALDVSFSDIGGLDKEIEELRAAIEYPQRFPDAFRKLNLRPTKGALLIGPPGCGKTMLGMALAKELGRRFLYFNGAEFLQPLLGTGEEKVRMVFAEARRESCIVFIDEAESILRPRDSAGINSQLFDPLVSQILGELDGLEKLNNVLVIFASNRRDIFDRAMIRPGRIDLILEIKAPGINGTKEIFRKYLVPTLPFDEDELKAENENTGAFTDRLIDEVTAYMFKEARALISQGIDVITGAIIEETVRNAKLAALKRLEHGIGQSLKILRSDIFESAQKAMLRRFQDIREERTRQK